MFRRSTKSVFTRPLGWDLLRQNYGVVFLSVDTKVKRNYVMILPSLPRQWGKVVPSLYLSRKRLLYVVHIFYRTYRFHRLGSRVLTTTVLTTTRLSSRSILSRSGITVTYLKYWDGQRTNPFFNMGISDQERPYRVPPVTRSPLVSLVYGSRRPGSHSQVVTRGFCPTHTPTPFPDPQTGTP